MRASTPASSAFAGSTSSPVSVVGWISLAALAQVLGRQNARAARDWCVRHDVPYRRDGKHNFARVEDVQRALEALPVHRPQGVPGEVARAAARVMTAGGRR